MRFTVSWRTAGEVERMVMCERDASFALNKPLIYVNVFVDVIPGVGRKARALDCAIGTSSLRASDLRRKKVFTRPPHGRMEKWE